MKRHHYIGLVGAAALLAATFGACGSEEDVTTPGTGAQGGSGAGGGAAGGGGGCPGSAPTCGVPAICCSPGEECVNEMQCLPTCDTVRCGDNLVDCCAGGQVCLDGVSCAADCSPGESLCGATLDTCCPASDVCLDNACVTPGSVCGDNFDCPDESWYCEASLGHCLPLPGGPVCEGQAQFSDIEPTLEWYWPGVDYNGFFYENIISSPAVGDVNGDGTPDVVVPVYHDSSTSDIILVVLSGAGDGQGNPELLFTIPSAADPTAPYARWVGAVALGNFDADPGLEIVYPTAAGGVRIADNDGVGDVCDPATYPGCSGTRATSPALAGDLWGGPTLADLDHDGMPDVVVRCVAMNGRNLGDPSLDFVNAAGCGDGTVVADLDEDGRPEVVDAARAITADPLVPGGTPLWPAANGVPPRFVAVADLFPDIPGPEVVDVSSGLYVMDGQTGAVLVGPGGSLVPNAVPIPGNGLGGPPTVADFDGDGLAEVSTAGLAAYVVYDPDCWSPPLRTGGACASATTNFVLWTTPTQDLSSSSTGSSVFDFQGDGPAEVLYNDECFFHIYDGTTGAELVNPKLPNSSRTAAEYPLVADVDGDGNAEMVVVSNGDQARNRDNCDAAWKAAGVDIDWLCQYTTCATGPACTGGVGGTCADVVNGAYLDAYQCDSQGICRLAGGTHGVKVYGDSFDRWVRTRPVWNQFAYHVTNFELAGGQWDVPTNEPPSWLSYNNYRQNVQGGVLFPVPNLTVELEASPLCPGEIRLTATVRNEGSAGAAAGVGVSFLRTDAGVANPPLLLDSAATTSTILPGGFERITFVYPTPPLGVDLEFAVTLDPGGLVEECNELDNAAVAGPVSCASGPA